MLVRTASALAAYALVAAIACFGAQNTQPSLASKLQPFSYFEGRWACAGTFVRTGKAIQADLDFEPYLDGAWLGFRQDDKAPNRYHAFSLWGWDRKQNTFVSLVADNLGGDRRFTSPGFQDAEIAWTNAPDHERFRFVKQAAKRFQVIYERQAQQTWTPIDSLTCIAAEFAGTPTE